MNDPRTHARAKRIHRAVVGPPGRRNPCFYCGKPASHADDLVPVSKGGNTKDRRNLVPACVHCNTSRGNRALPKRDAAERQTVFSGRTDYIPRYGRISLPHPRRATLAADYSRRPLNARAG